MRQQIKEQAEVRTGARGRHERNIKVNRAVGQIGSDLNRAVGFDFGIAAMSLYVPQSKRAILQRDNPADRTEMNRRKAVYDPYRDLLTIERKMATIIWNLRAAAFSRSRAGYAA